MASEWSSATVQELAKKISIGPFGSSLKTDAYTPAGVPVIRGTNLCGGRYFIGDWVYVSDSTADRLPAANVSAGDLVFPHRGSIGEVGIVPADRPRYLLSTSLMRASLDDRVCDSRFYFYFFRSQAGRAELLKNASQVGTPGIGQPLSTLKAIRVPVPELSEQKRIADLLCSLDDRIDHNRALAANLEAIARALFKSWFVNFDPVRAKAAGEAPLGLAPDLAELFADRFVDSELGEIPEGWSVKALDEAFDLNPRRSLTKGADAPYLDMASTPTKGHVADQVVSREFTSGTKFVNSDTLLARITPCLENGKAAYVDFLKEQEVGWGSTEFIVLRPKAPLPPYFGYLLARYAPFKAHAISSMSGTSGRQRVQPDSLSTWELAVPNQAVAKEFGTIVEPLRAAIAGANQESRVIAKMRDLLLPRLISGKLRVEDAEAALEAA